MSAEDNNAKTSMELSPLRRRDGGMVPLTPTNLEDAHRLASRLANSALVPMAMRQKPDDVFAAMLLCMEAGIPIMQGISNIAVVNGRASFWGELATAVVRNSGLCEYLKAPVWSGSGPTLSCTVAGKRKNDPEEASFTYSMEDAKLAGHTEKDTYKKNPKDMIMWKAMHRLFKFLWPDALKGISIREIAGDEDAPPPARVIISAEAEAIPSASEPVPTKEVKAELVKPEEQKGKPEPAPAPAPKPEVKPEPAKAAAEPIEAEAELTSEPAKPEEKKDSVKGKEFTGIVSKVPYKLNATDKTKRDYFLVMLIEGAEKRFMLSDLAQAEAVNEFKKSGKPIVVIANDAGLVLEYKAK